MTTRLILLSQAATPAMRQGRFPDDDALDERGRAGIAELRLRLPIVPDAVVLCSPLSGAMETALTLGLQAQACKALSEQDFGEWCGRDLADVAAETPAALQAWLRDPAAVPPGGESFDALLLRVGKWMDSMREHKTVIAITHASVMRAAVLYALNVPSSAFVRVDVPALSMMEVRHSGAAWTWRPAQ